MEVNIINTEGKSTGSLQLNDAVFGIEPSKHTVYLEVRQYLANQRQGTHAAKERSAVKGSTRKIKKQKGTGTARAGDIKNPLFRGGGRVFGPRPRSYSFKLNKSQKRVAKKSALSILAQEERLHVIDDISFDKPSTKEFIKFLGNLGLSQKKTLIVLGEPNKFVYLSSRNLKGVKVVNSSELSSYDLLDASKVVMTKRAIELLEENLVK